MPAGRRPWTSETPLAELTLGFDWDSVAAMIASLREQLFEHGTIPVWNFTLCGGRPELAVPFSWAWTWPSAFAYALAPNHAILALWILLGTVGFLALRACLLRWTGSRLAAAVGAAVYAISGYFGAHFNVGHVTFAFFHLVPVLLLLFETGFDRRLAHERAAGAVALSTLLAFLLLSGGLPHALLHLYPAFALWVLLRAFAAARAHGSAAAGRALAPLLVAQALGAWLAGYKLWPVLRWQMELPRRGTFEESYGLGALLAGTLVPLPLDTWRALQPWRRGLDWELHAFVGPLPWLLAALALATAFAARGASARERRVSLYAAALVIAGLALSLGNAHPASPAQAFRHLPVLSAVRCFGRYQILTVLGLAILCAQGLARVGAYAARRPRLLALPAALALATLVPLVLDVALLVWCIPAAPNAEILARYGDPPRPDPPQLVGVAPVGSVAEPGHQSSLLSRGFWIANCSENLTLPGPALEIPPGSRIALASPPPIALQGLARDRIALAFPPAQRGRVQLNLRVPEGFEVDAPVRRLGGWRVSAARAELAAGRLSVTAVYPGPREGAVASAAGAAAALALAVAWWRRARAAPPRA